MPMPTDDLMKVTVGGKCFADTWQSSFWIRLTGLSGTPTSTQLDTNAATIGTQFGAPWSTNSNPLKAANMSGVDFSVVKLAVYRSGALVNSVIHPVTPIAGTSVATGSAPTGCLVMTLLTGLAGRTNRGRMYWPVTAACCSPTTGLQTLQSVSGTVANFKAWWDTINASANANLPGTPTQRVVVVSQGGISSSPHTTTVVSLRMDDKLDSQRGRSNKLVPATLAVSNLA